MTSRFGFEIVAGVLAFVGLWVTVDKTTAGILRAWRWLRRDRSSPLLEDEPGCACCEDGGRCYGVDPDECGQCGHPETWHAADFDLPPEQSAADLGFTDPAAADPLQGFAWAVDDLRGLTAQMERRAPWWEAEHRAAYDALGFDYPSGMMARVRELTP